MRLVELDPQFRLWRSDKALGKTDDASQAQGITFDCPKQSATHRSHWILVWFKDREVPLEAEPLHRWTAAGTSYDDLTLTPSIDATVKDPSCWHGFITNGAIT